MAKNNEEIERRFLVLSIDPDYKRGSEPKHIIQGYLHTPDHQSLRVRIINGRTAVITRKSGKGLVREEIEHPLPLETAQMILECCPWQLTKTRYVREGFEVDEFHGKLAGLIIAEFEMESADQEVKLPPWIKEAVEVTDSLTNLHLARLAADLADDAARPVRESLPKRVPRIVLTGGPCSGKSTIMQLLGERLRDRVHCVPEVATIVIGQVGILPPQEDGPDMRRFQRTLARVQEAFEDISNDQAVRDGKQALLLDRGLMDNAAYLPGGIDMLEELLGTRRYTIFNRYQMVLSLSTAPRDVYDQALADHPARRETYEQALERAAQTREVWSEHPWLVPINEDLFEDKVREVEETIEYVLELAATPRH